MDQDVALKDRDDPRALMNIVPPVIRQRIEEIPAEMFAMEDKEIARNLPRGITVTDRRLRTSFWMEYARAQDVRQTMNMSNVYSGICSKDYFYGGFMQTKLRMAYMLMMPTNYEVAVEEALICALDEMLDILKTPHIDDEGKPITALMGVKKGIFQLLENRVKGAVVQRVEQKNLNVNVDAKKSEAQPQSLDEINRKLKELEHKASASHAILPVEIEVDSTHLGEDENETQN